MRAGFGFPVHKDGCAHAEPETGWLAASDGSPPLTPARILGNDAAGQAFAREHGEVLLEVVLRR